jgi:class 3 adenylate cyclase
MTAADFQAAGLYDPAAPDAAARLELLEWLAAQGATLADMQDAQHRWGSLTGLAGDLALRAGERLTLAEVAARAGMSPERVERISLAAGFPPVARDERAFDAERTATFSAFAMGEALFGTEPMLHFIRVLGSALGRVAEAAVSLFIANIEAPLVDRAQGELAIAQANLRAIKTLDSIPDAVRAMFRAQVEVAIRRLRAARAERAMHDTVRLTVGFVDLVGYTRLAQQLDAHAIGALVERFEALASDVVAAHDGRVVKLVGDAVMFVAVRAGAACDIALTLVERFAGDPAVTPRGGLATGQLLARGGDYYGSAVNLASRIGELAVPREILVTAEVAADAAAEPLRFEPAGRRILKGFGAPVALYAVARA